MRPKLTLIIFFLFFVAVDAHAISCNRSEFLGRPELRDNAKFWEEFGAKGHMSDDQFTQLVAKYKVDIPERRVNVRLPDAPSPVPTGAPRFSLSKQAVKDSRRFETQRPALKKDLDQFLDFAKNGAGYLRQQLMQNPGKWNYKKLEGQIGGRVAYSARLDGGVRVVFHQTENGLIDIIGIDNAITH